MATWVKVGGEWMARGTWEELSHKYVTVMTHGGRETLCEVLELEALGEAEDYSRAVTAKVRRTAKTARELMAEVPWATGPA